MQDEISFSEENKKQIETLKSKIKSAFSQTKQPAWDNIALHECEECLGVRKDFVNVNWQKASDELLEKNYDKLPLFSPDAFKYFLPAFLLYTLRNFDEDFSEVCEFTLYAITPGKSWKDDNGQISSYWVEKFSAFTEEQMNTIYEFLTLAEQNPIYTNDKTSIQRSFERLKAIKSASEKSE